MEIDQQNCTQSSAMIGLGGKGYKRGGVGVWWWCGGSWGVVMVGGGPGGGVEVQGVGVRRLVLFDRPVAKTWAASVFHFPKPVCSQRDQCLRTLVKFVSTLPCSSR